MYNSTTIICKGEKVKFIHNGLSQQVKEALEIGLRIGEVYSLRYCSVSGFDSTVCLKEFPNEEFNSVMFEGTPPEFFETKFLRKYEKTKNY